VRLHLPHTRNRAALILTSFSQAFRIAQEGARRGCPHSRGALALCWASGWGCTKDCARALQLARCSAAADSKFGQYACGWLHFNSGTGAAQDDSLAARFFRQAAAQRLDAAQWAVGYLHERGLGVAQSCSEAIMWFQLASAQGMPWACASLALMYELGRGTAADEDRAIRWLQRALDAGHYAALRELRRLKRGR
jgi:TPR repeat protein